MSDIDGNFMWTPPSSATPNLMNEIFPQATLPRDPNDQSEQRPGLGERLASRTGFNPPTLETENISPFAGFFMNQTISSPITAAFSQGLSPSALLQSPMFSNSSQIILPHLNTNDGPLEMVGSSDEGNETTLICNNDLPPHQPLNADLLSLEESRVEPLSAPFADTDFPHQWLDSYMAPQQGNDDLTHQQLMNFFMPEEDNFVYIPSPEPNGVPLLASVESDIVEETNNDLFHHALNADLPSQEEEPLGAQQPLNVNLPNIPPQEESDHAVDNVNIISVEDENNSEAEKDKVEDHEVIDLDDHEAIDVDELNAGSSSSNKRKLEATDMIGTIRTTKTQRVILQMESEEDNPNDGFRWRKYGSKVIKGNPNPRSYYRCSNNGCNVKKRIERGAKDDRLVVTTYDGIHNHPTPTVRPKGSMSQNRTNRSASSLTIPSSSFWPSMDMSVPSSSFGTQTDMTGFSRLPSLPVNHQNPGFTYRNEEPVVNATPDGTGVFNRIVRQIYANFGQRLSMDMM